MTSSTPTLSIGPSFRIQILFENEPGTPTKEFSVGDLSELSFDAVLSRAFSLSIPNETDKSQYDYTFKYNFEERHESRWINFQDTQGLYYAIQSNQDKGYVFISACIVKKGAVLAPRPDPVVSTSTKASSTKPKVAKKTKSTKPKAPTASRGSNKGKGPVDQLILAALKEKKDLGILAPTRLEICACSGYSCLTSKGYVAGVKKLKDSGYIEYPSKETIALTAEGEANAPSNGPKATTNEEVQARLKNMLKGKGGEIMDILSDGLPHEREEVMRGIGYSCLTSKGFTTALKQMKDLNMIIYPKDVGKKKLVQLTDIAFPFGRPGGGTVVAADNVVSDSSISSN